MTEESIIHHTEEFEIFACCPTTDTWVVGQISSRYDDLGLEATWWDCPVCQGCHVSFKVTADNVEEAVFS